jgi:acetolactate synthase-1/2/3 large subunit
MNTAQFMIQCLEKEGVQYIFGVPGEENEHFILALEDSTQIKFIPTRHEQGAAFIANIMGRLTGKAGVCLATLGPGATNLMTGLAEANSDKAPVLALTAQGSTDRLHHESHQVIDVCAMMQKISKYSADIIHPDITAEVVRKAFKLAEAEKPGVTHIQLPENIAAAEVSENLLPIPVRTRLHPAPNPILIEEAVRTIANAKHPLILAGNGVIRDGASPLLTKFAQQFNIPVAHTFKGKGAIDDRLDQSLFAVGLGFEDYVLEAFNAADVVLVIGYDIGEYAPDNWNKNHDKLIIHIDFTPAEVYAAYTPLVEIVADISLTISALNHHLSENIQFVDWFSDIRRRIAEDIESYKLKGEDSLTVPGILHEIRNIAKDDSILLSDVGSHKMWIARNYPSYQPHNTIFSNGLASMGIALPGAIGAAMAEPKRQIIAFMGDGGFMMNMQEMETATRLGLGFTIIVTVDADYGLISWKQERSVGESHGTTFTNPDFIKLSEAFGIKAHHPKTVTELKEALSESINSKEMRFIAIPIDTYVNGELTDKLKEYFA